MELPRRKNRLMLIVRFLIAIVVAFFAGKLISKIKMPAILGWLLVVMILGPHALGVMNGEVLETSWYLVFLNIFEVVVVSESSFHV